MSFWDDSFTGNNGDAVDATKWVPQDFPSIFNNKLKLEAIGSLSIIPAVYSTCVLRSDFSLEILCDLTTGYPSGIPPETGVYSAAITAWINSTHYIYVGFDYNAAHRITSVYANGAAPVPVTVSRTNHYGTLKITRTGHSYRTFISDGSGVLTELGTARDVGSTADVCSIFIALNRSVGEGYVVALFDDFKITSGASSIPTNGHDVLGYINNPYWTQNPTAMHSPCGYWRKNTAVAVATQVPIYGENTNVVFTNASCVWASAVCSENIYSIICYNGDLYGISVLTGCLYKRVSGSWVKVTSGDYGYLNEYQPYSALRIESGVIKTEFYYAMYSVEGFLQSMNKHTVEWDTSLPDFIYASSTVADCTQFPELCTFPEIGFSFTAENQDFLYGNHKFEIIVSAHTLGYYDGDGVYHVTDSSTVNLQPLRVCVCGDYLYALNVDTSSGQVVSTLHTIHAQETTTLTDVIIGYREVTVPSVLVLPDAVWPFTDLGGKKWGGLE